MLKECFAFVFSEEDSCRQMLEIKHAFLKGGRQKGNSEGKHDYAKLSNQQIKISKDIIISLIRLDAKWPFRLSCCL